MYIIYTNIIYSPIIDFIFVQLHVQSKKLIKNFITFFL